MKTPLFLLCLATQVAVAQVSDHFSDGNFSTNPEWIGDDSLFRVNAAFQLQSYGTTNKDVSLTTPVSFDPEMEWSCWVKFNLSPSTANFCRYYLMSDNTNLKGPLNGYYVQFGGVTGNTDSIVLYKQKGINRIRIIAGRAATVSKTTNVVRIKVLRDVNGNWELFSDTTGGHSYMSEGRGYDTEFSSNGYVGMFVRFTSSNARNYFFDDMYAGPPIIDTTPPRIDSMTVLSANQIRIVFSEAVTPITALDVLNYNITDGIGTPVNAEVEPGKTNVVLLELDNPLENKSYSLKASGISDLQGNMSSEDIVSFTYAFYIPQENDILISEFFPDPSPSVGLPEKEFIELYNRAPVSIELEGWSISDGTTTSILGKYELDPDSFVIVCSASNSNDYRKYGKVIPVNSLPSLNNSSDKIMVRDKTEKVIHQLEYDLNWYGDESKKEGGYTLELTNPNQLCLGKQNYSASAAISGGTPGYKNSKWNTRPDTIPPVWVTVTAIDSQSVAIAFNEPMDSLSLITAPITLPGYLPIKRKVTSSKDTLLVSFSPSFIANQPLSISISQTRDCSGNLQAAASKTFRYLSTEPAHQFDVLITEIMSDPDPPVQLPNAEFIEIHNRSSRYISLKGWTLSDPTSIAVLPTYILQPDSFCILTSVLNSSTFMRTNSIGLNGFPSLGNDGDQLTLADEKGRVIHHVAYTSKAYRDNRKQNGGWSLELIDESNPCGGDYSFMSSSNPKGGTPGYANSVLQPNRDDIAPKLVKTYPITTNQLIVTFDEPMDSLTLINTSLYTCNDLPNGVSHLQLQAPDYREIILTFTDTMKPSTTYRLVIDSVADCAGNSITSQNTSDFGWPDSLDSGDLVINELLFDPKTGGADYVELFNRSNKILDLTEVWLANTNSNNEIQDVYPIDSLGRLFFPKTYVVITSDKAAVQQQYFTPYPQQLIQTKIPAYSNDEGSCILLKGSEKYLDRLDYASSMHYPLLDTKDGVSLERIDFTRPSSDASNWTSASSTSGFGTPTYQNSQYAHSQTGKNIVQHTPEVFSPDGDGEADVITFSYTLPAAGYTANMRLYDASGKLIKQLLRNEILGTTGAFSWNGITDKGEKATIGIYLYYFEAFNLKGDMIKAKSTLVVGTKL